MPNDPLLARALAVLAKADSTTFEEERSALVYGAYVLLARHLAAHPTSLAPDGRRRERRFVADRRRRRHRAEPPSRPRPGVAYLADAPQPGPGGVLDATI